LKTTDGYVISVSEDAGRSEIYAARAAKRNKWTGEFPVEGNVLSFLCSRCGRIALYGAAVARQPGDGKDDKADR
jgi:hypothetical protein